jgi:superfamily I DNA/RNA helicase
MEVITSVRNLKKRTGCCTRQKFKVQLQAPVTDAMNQAKITLNAVKSCFNGTLDAGNIQVLSNYFLSSYMEANMFTNNETCSAVALRTANEVSRMVNSCAALGLKPTLDVQPELVDMGHDVKVNVHPDLMFISQAGNGIVLRSVILQTSRPVRTQKSIDEGKDFSLDLYAMILFNRQYADKMYAANTRVLNMAEIWYLRRANDRLTGLKAYWDSDFFNVGGQNVVGINEIYCAGQLNFRSVIDDGMEKQVKDFAEGTVKCSEDDCKYCDIRSLCKYQKPDIPVQTDPVVKEFKQYTLNDEQKRIIQLPFDGFYRVIAKAGTGKTTTISFRNAYMYAHGINPKTVLNITFTVLAAGETTDRVLAISKAFGLNYKASDIRSMTIDALLYTCIQNNYADFGFTEVPQLYDNENNRLIIRNMLDQHIVKGIDYAHLKMDERFAKGGIAVANKIFSVMRERNLTVNDFDTVKSVLGEFWYRFVSSDASVKEIMSMYPEYRQHLKDQNLITYADFQVLMDEKLKMDPHFLDTLGYQYIIVDEFQDTSDWQVNFVKKLTETSCFRGLMVVGDDAQAIYGFRGTSSKGILTLQNILNKPVIDQNLVKNYRSTPEILELADKIYQNNIHKTAAQFVPMRPSKGMVPTVQGFMKTDEEYQYILDRVKALIAAGEQPSDIAILAATSNELQHVKALLDEAGIQNVSLNPEKMIDNYRVQAAISLVKAIANPDDTQSLLVYANAKRFGGLLDESIQEQQASIDMATVEIGNINALQGKDKKDAIIGLLKSLDMDDEIYEAFLTKVSSMKLEDMMYYILNFEDYGSDNKARKTKTYLGVVLTTAHSSKGLEWKNVILSVSKFDTQELHREADRARTLGDPYNNPFEERNRLLYVACTRARENLNIVGQFVAFGSKRKYTLNYFLREVYNALNVYYPEMEVNAELQQTK